MDFRFARHLDAMADWRQGLGAQLAAFERLLAGEALLEPLLAQRLAGLRARLDGDQLVLAFVAEFSRGKSELINAIFFADTGRRVLPATPGRTTMCPVELGWDAATPPMLALLPIETRLDAEPLAALKAQSARWQRRRLDPADAAGMAEALREITRTKAVSREAARRLGLADEGTAVPKPRDDGLVDVPAWRHAIVNYPHPLLQRGLVVLDTPGLNAVGAEPELTLSLLPAAHAVVFIVAADAGVTHSELSLWREHLDGPALTRFVVLNKVDTLADPLLGADEVARQVDAQCAVVAEALQVPRAGVYPLSARQALAARVGAAAAGAGDGGLAPLEVALVDELLPRRHHVLAGFVVDGLAAVEDEVLRSLADSRRQVQEQLHELRDVRGKNGTKLQWTIDRLDAEAREFEHCTSRLVALRAVQGRLLGDALAPMGADALRELVAQLQAATSQRVLPLGARKHFTALCTRLRALLQRAAGAGAEVQAMLTASYQQLNSDFGFALAVSAPPSLGRSLQEIDLIERSYGRYLGLPQALRLADGRRLEQFCRMLQSKLELVFEHARDEIERWSLITTGQVDMQLRDRRRAFQRRRETLERAHGAACDLAERIEELEVQERRWQGLAEVVAARAAALRAQAMHEPAPVDIPLAIGEAEPLSLDTEPAATAAVQAG